MLAFLRRLLTLLLVIVSCVCVSATFLPRDFAAVGAAQDPARITVYITKTGEKYHRDGCRYLSRSRIQTTLKVALERGLGPCSVCKHQQVDSPQLRTEGTSEHLKQEIAK